MGKRPRQPHPTRPSKATPRPHPAGLGRRTTGMPLQRLNLPILQGNLPRERRPSRWDNPRAPPDPLMTNFCRRAEVCNTLFETSRPSSSVDRAAAS